MSIYDLEQIRDSDDSNIIVVTYIYKSRSPKKCN